MMQSAKGEILNIYGRKGWELISIMMVEDDEDEEMRYFFKRSEE